MLVFYRRWNVCRSKPPLFSPWLDPDRVAEKIVQTIIKERVYLKMPFIVKFIPFFRGRPTPLLDRLGKIMGLDGVMDNFRGH